MRDEGGGDIKLEQNVCLHVCLYVCVCMCVSVVVSLLKVSDHGPPHAFILFSITNGCGHTETIKVPFHAHHLWSFVCLCVCMGSNDCERETDRHDLNSLADK